MKKHAIIVAGGRGMRMGGSLRKQFLPVGGIPILMHTLNCFYDYSPEINLVLVLPGDDLGYWKRLCEKHHFSLPHFLVEGGPSRFHSVRNGLESIEGEEGLVAIHDGVRPFVTQEIISSGFGEAAILGSAIAVVPLQDSLRKLNPDGNSCFQEREYFRLVQTPQTFQLSKIKQAYKVSELPQFTDDATVYEFQGWQVNLIKGHSTNIKITTPEDLEYADFLVKKKQIQSK